MPAGEAAWAPHDQHHADAVIGQIALHPREGNAVVSGADHQSVVRQAACVERIEHRTDPTVEYPRTGVEGRHILPGLRAVGEKAGRQAIPRMVLRPWRGELAVSLGETNGQEEGLPGHAAQVAGSGRGDVFDATAWKLYDLVVPNALRPLGHVLDADQRRAVACLAKRVQDVLARVR